MRLGIYGGTFDPVHFGHLLLAEFCREACQLDEVWFVPAAVPPHKQGQSVSTAAQRLEMLALAIGGHESFRVCSHEIERGGVSYTVETLAAIQAEDPARELFFLLGADSLVDLPLWREPARICELATLVVVARTSTPEPDFGCLTGIASPERIAHFRRHLVPMPLIELSSSEIRRRIGAGRSIRFQTPRAVEKYIETATLYQA
ncbi:MAG: nicotinate-nucleotide adenylyltransferase [Pirellulales bacterium]|nr:nicotinate-nucleotide adenylyltransferase [Pirellulales bacterium]